MNKKKIDILEYYTVLLFLSFAFSVGTLGLLGTMINVVISEVDLMAIIGWVFGLTGVYFSVILIRNEKGRRR